MEANFFACGSGDRRFLARQRVGGEVGAGASSPRCGTSPDANAGREAMTLKEEGAGRCWRCERTGTGRRAGSASGTFWTRCWVTSAIKAIGWSTPSTRRMAGRSDRVLWSASQTVVGSRLKGARMRWSEAGAHAVCHVRAFYRSESGSCDADPGVAHIRGVLDVFSFDAAAGVGADLRAPAATLVPATV